MNNDLISREVLKKELEVTPYNDIDDLVRTEKLIDNAPTVEERPQGEWIPVSERLPEEEGDYLLWGKIDESEEDEYPFIGSYDEGCEQFGIWQEHFGGRTLDGSGLASLGSEFYAYSKVVAWQPLPKPYRGRKTMKLIIDVDEKLVCEGFERTFTEEERDMLIRAIGNGVEYVEPKKGINLDDEIALYKKKIDFYKDYPVTNDIMVRELEFFIDLLEQLKNEPKKEKKDNLTNGDMIMAMFPNTLRSDYFENGLMFIYLQDEKESEMVVFEDWWNAPYKEADNEL